MTVVDRELQLRADLAELKRQAEISAESCYAWTDRRLPPNSPDPAVILDLLARYDLFTLNGQQVYVETILGLEKEKSDLLARLKAAEEQVLAEKIRCCIAPKYWKWFPQPMCPHGR